MPAEVIVDTAGLTTWAWGHEDLHLLARDRWERLREDGFTLIIPETSFLEALSTIQRAVPSPSDGKQVAIVLGKLLKGLERLGGVQIVQPTKSQKREAWEIFEEACVAEMTFSDCLCVAIARRMKISDVFSHQRFYSDFQLSPLLASG